MLILCRAITHVEVCCLLEQQKRAKDFVQIGIDVEDYYRIKDSEKVENG